MIVGIDSRASAKSKQDFSSLTLEHRISRLFKRYVPASFFQMLSLLSIQLQSWINPKNCPYWSKVTPMLYVGAMPLSNSNHPQKLQKLGIRAILSINEESEFTSRFCATPAQKEEWEEKKFTYLRLSSPDLEPVAIATIAKAVDFIAEQISSQKPTYVHCMGGRGRSVSAVIAYLITKEEMPFDCAMEYLKMIRPQINISPEQQEAVKAYTSR